MARSRSPSADTVHLQVKRTRDQAEGINVQRKGAQEAIESTLWNLAHRRTQGSEKNLQIQLACEGLRAEVKRLRTLASKASST